MITDTGEDWEYVEGGKVYEGNSDQDTIVVNKLENPIKCHAIRICPTEWNNHIALRFEVFYGNL